MASTTPTQVPTPSPTGSGRRSPASGRARRHRRGRAIPGSSPVARRRYLTVPSSSSKARMGLRASIPTRRAAVVLIAASAVVTLTINRAIAQASEAVAAADAQNALDTFAPATSTTPPPTAPTSRVARVLLLGDSVMDQQGSAAEFLLRQAGV